MNAVRTDVVLVATMRFLTKETVQVMGDHAAPLVAPVEGVNDSLRLRWFSFGDGLDPAEVNPGYTEILDVHHDAVFEHSPRSPSFAGLCAAT